MNNWKTGKPAHIRLGQWFCIYFKIENSELFYGNDENSKPIIKRYLSDWQYVV